MTLYISDLDGTLLGSGGKLKPRTADMLNDFIASGTAFSYCTARSAVSADRIMSDVKLDVPVILMNGVFIYDTCRKEYIRKNAPSEKETELLKEAAVKLGETPMVHSFIDDEIRISYIEGSKNLRHYLSERKDDKRLRPVDGYEDMFVGEIFYAVFLNPKDIDALDEYFDGRNGFSRVCYHDVYKPDEIWYEVFSSRAGKDKAVLQLKEITGADEIVSFGDNGNDLPMFSASDRCYAVENAIEKVKERADAVIGSNDSYGVTEFIEGEAFDRFDFVSLPKEIDDERFSQAVEKAVSRKRSTIGTLNEKTIHNALKCYYGGEMDHEAKIGEFYADIAGENGIIEIQTGSFSKLMKKLSKMLRLCHVTVVYPYEKIVNNYSINENTGEIISSSRRSNRNYSKFFLELYRIKAFLSNPNLTVIIAELETEQKTFYKDNRRIRYKGLRKEKLPLRLIREIRLENKADYAVFLPGELPEKFTKKELQKLCKPNDASLLLEIAEFMGIVKRIGKEGNSILFKRNI